MAVLRYTIRAKDEFSDTFNRLINLSETASGFIIANLGLRAADAISTMTSQAVEDFTSVEVALSRVAAATGKYGDAADELIDNMEEEIKLGSKLGFSMTESANALQLLTMAGFSVKDALLSMTPIMEIATIETMSMSEAVTLTTTILGMYSLEAKDSARVTGVLANAAIHGILPISKIGMGLAYVGKQAANMGSSLEETTAALVLSTNQGLRAHMAGRYLRRMFEDLVDSEDKLGFSIRDSTGQMLNLTTLLEALDGHLKTLRTGYEKTSYVSDIFGVQSQTLVYALTGVGIGGTENIKILKYLTDEMSKAGTASAMAAEIMRSFWGVMRRFRAELSQVAVDLGSHLTPMLSALLPATMMAADALRDMLNPALDMTSRVITTLTPAFAAFASIISIVGPSIIKLTVAYLALRLSINVVLGSYKRLTEFILASKLVWAVLYVRITDLIAALRLVPQWFGVIPQSMSIVLGRINVLSPALAGLVAGLRGVAGMTFTSTIAMKLYTLALKANAAATMISTVYMNLLGNALASVALWLGITTGQAILFAYASGLIIIAGVLYLLIRAFQALGSAWKTAMDKIRDTMAGATNSIIGNFREMQEAIESMRTEMNEFGRSLNAIDQIVQMNQLRIQALQKAIEDGTMSVQEAAIAIDLLTEANRRLNPILAESRLLESGLRNDISALNVEIGYHLNTLEKLRTARIAVAEAQLAEQTRNALTKDQIDAISSSLDDLGISYKKITKGILIGKRITFDFMEILEQLDEVIAGHELTGDQLADALANLEDNLSDLSEKLGMSRSDWEAFWRNIEETTSMRGRSMLGVLGMIGVALGKLDYAFGATNREIERLSLRYRENELMIRETEKAMKEGRMSYVEGAAKIRALRKENEEIALARDEARLEQDKLNLAYEEASETVEAYQYAITGLIREHEGLLARKQELEQMIESGIELTDAEKLEYQELTTAISNVQAKLVEYRDRLDEIKDRFPAIETGVMNLRTAIRDFASNLSTDFIGPVDAALTGLIADIDTAFSTEFDFLPPNVNWDPIWDVLDELTETDWEINLILLIDQSGIGDIDEIIDEIKDTSKDVVDDVEDVVDDIIIDDVIDEDLTDKEIPWTPTDEYRDWKEDEWWDEQVPGDLSLPGIDTSKLPVAEPEPTIMDVIQDSLETLGEAEIASANSYLAMSDAMLDGMKNVGEAIEGSMEIYGEALILQAEADKAYANVVADRVGGFLEDPLGSIGRGIDELGSLLGSLFDKPTEPTTTPDINIYMDDVTMTGPQDAEWLAQEIAMEIEYAENRVRL